MRRYIFIGFRKKLITRKLHKVKRYNSQYFVNLKAGTFAYSSRESFLESWEPNQIKL